MPNPEDILREQFEHYYSDHGVYPQAVERAGDDSYVFMGAHTAWTAWQAAWAAARAWAASAPAEPAAVPAEPVAYFFRFHTDASLRGEPNVRSWTLAEGAPPANLSRDVEIRPLIDAQPPQQSEKEKAR